MNGIKIRGMGHAVPQQVMTNDRLAQIVDTNDEWITTRTGIRRRHHCTSETHTDLCVQAARMALEKAGVDPSQIGACIVATLTPDTIIPSAACRLQKELGLPEDSLCFDLNAACTGFVFGMHTMECLLTASPRKFGLVLGAEALSHIVNWQDRSTCILFGDGAGAAVVESNAAWKSIGAVTGVRGDDELLRTAGPGTNETPVIAMEGSKVFKFAVEAVPACIDQLLTKHELQVEDIDYFVFHQANARIIDLVVRKYHIPETRYYKNIEEYGNTSAASIPLVLSELQAAGKVGPGSKVLMVGFGGGLTWGGAIAEFA